MQNSSQQLSTKNYSMNSTARRTNKAKQRRSIFSVPEPVEPQRIRRIKNRRNMVRNYRDKIRDIYHQTDYLVSWKDEDLSCFIKPIEQTGSFAFFEKSTRSNFSTLSAAYAGDTYSKYKDITLPYNSTESQPSHNFTESSNLVSIPTGTFSNSLYSGYNENANSNQIHYDLNESKQDQSNLGNNEDEEQIQTCLSDNDNEEQFRASLNDEENEEQVQGSYDNEGAQPQLQDGFNEANEDHIGGDYYYQANEEQNQVIHYEIEEEEQNQDDNQPWVADGNNSQNYEDQTMEQSTNFTEFSAIQATSQRDQQNIQSKYDIYPENDVEEESNADDKIDLSVNVIVIEEEEEVDEDEFHPFEDENIESIFVKLDNLPIDDQYAPVFVTFQHYTEQNIPIGHQYIFNVNQSESSVFNFTNVNASDIIEALVFLNDDEENPTLVSGIRLPVRSVDWDCSGVQVFDLISADDLRSGINASRGDAGKIELVFKVL